MILLITGSVLVGVATILDSIFRWRMTRVGYNAAMIQGGAFNYAEYHRIRKDHGWPAWPVYLMWLLVTLGIGLLIVGFFVRFGTSAQH